MPRNLPTLPQYPCAVRRLGMGVLLLGALAPCGCGDDSAAEPASAAPVPVLVRAVDRLNRPAYVALSGDVVAGRTVNVGFMVPGQVASVGPQEGDRVTEGQVLAELDPTDYQFNLDIATAQRERAEDEHARAEKVFEEKGIPENDFHKVETALRIATAQEGIARKKLADSRLESPLTGVLAYRGVEPGEQVGPGLPVFTVVEIDPAQVRVGVPETEIGNIAEGQRAIVTIPALNGAAYQGKVRVVGMAADPASRTYTVKIEVANGKAALKPGMIAEVRIEKSDSVRALTVPGEAIVRDAAGVTRVFVYVPDEQRVHQRRVQVGTVHDQAVEIQKGLQGDEMVVVGGQSRVREGSTVVARTDESAGGAASTSSGESGR